MENARPPQGALSQITSEEVQALKRSIHELPTMVEDVMKRAILPMVQAMRLEAQEFRALIPLIVGEVLQKLDHIPRSRYFSGYPESSASRKLKLHFLSNFPDTLLTFNSIKDEGATLKVELRDGSGSRVEDDPEASVKIKIFVLDGDFEVDDTDDWTHQDFEKNIARPRKDKGPLLKGNCEFYMENGVANVSDIAFTDNSKSMRNGKFRLGAQAVKGLPPGVEIRGAVSKAFQVKERRGKFYRKYRSPSLGDDTHCLKNIGKTLCQRLAEKQIHTVKDFLQLCHTDANELQNILKLAGNKWTELVENAKMCSLNDEHYLYRDEASRIDLVLDCVFNVVIVTFNDRVRQPYRDLTDSQKELVNRLRLVAYEKRKELPTITETGQTSMQVESFSPSVIPHSNALNLDAAAADSPMPMPGMDPDMDSMLERQESYRTTSNQTEQGEQELLPHQHHSSNTSPNSSFFEGVDNDLCDLLKRISDTAVGLHVADVPQDPMSHINVDFKRQRC